MIILDNFLNMFDKESINISDIIEKIVYCNLEKISEDEVSITFYTKRNRRKAGKDFPVYKCGMIQVNMKEKTVLSYMTWKKSSRTVSPMLKVIPFDIECDFMRYINEFKIIDKIYNEEY